MPPRAVIQQNFSGGSNLVTNPYVTGAQQGVRQTNLLLSEHGSLRTRPGTLIQTTAPASGRRIVRIFDLVRLDGTIFKLAILRGGAANELYDRSPATWVLKGTFSTVEDIPDILSFTDKALIVNGYEVPKSFDGTTFAALTGTPPPGAKHHSVHLSFYWVWNTSATTTATDGPSSLRSSDLNNPNSWPLANQIFIAKDDGQKGQGLAQFTVAESGISPIDTQIAFKDFSAYQITSVFGSTDFTIQKIKSDMGCVAPRTIQFCSGFGILRLTHRGVAQFDGVDDRLISEEVRPLLFGGSGFLGIDWTNVGVAYAGQVANPPLYVLYCPTNGPGLDRVFCYDLVRQAWTVLQYPVAVSSVQQIANPDVLPVVLTGDFSATAGVFATVRRTFVDTDLTDDGTAIAWEAVLRPIGGSSPQGNGYFRRAVVKLINVTQGQLINWFAGVGPITTGILRQKSGTLTVPATIEPSSGTGLGYGLAPYGTSPWGGGVPNTEVDMTIDIGLIGTNLRLVLAGTGPITIRGVEYHVSPRPVARPTVFA